jgi:hypothetical protein
MAGAKSQGEKRAQGERRNPWALAATGKAVQIAQLQQYQQTQAAAMRARIYWQTQVASYQAQTRAAQEELVRCMKEGDHVGAAAAARALTVACLHMIRLGVE